MRKTNFILQMALIFAICNVVFAGKLEKDGNNYYYLKDDGKYAVNEWVSFDLEKDGTEESYYFNEEGKLLVNAITPDGYKVNDKGQWVENGVVKHIEVKKEKEKTNLSEEWNNSIEEYKTQIDKSVNEVNNEIDKAANEIKGELGVLGSIYGDAIDSYADIYKNSMNQVGDAYKEVGDMYESIGNSYSNLFSGLW